MRLSRLNCSRRNARILSWGDTLTNLSDWIASNAPSNDEALAASVTYATRALGAYILLVDPKPIFGWSGLAWRMANAGVTLEQLRELEDALSHHPWWTDAVSEVIKKELSRRNDLKLGPPVTITRPALMERIKAAGISLDVVQPLDEVYSLPTYEELIRIAPHVTNMDLYYGQRTDLVDCDNLARYQWGILATLQPGNLAAGFCIITGFVDGVSFAHLLILVICTTGLYFLEGDGTVYPFGSSYYNRTGVQVRSLII